MDQSVAKPNIKGEITPLAVSFTWNIRNFCANCPKVGENFESPTFYDTWSLKLYPKNEVEELQDHLAIYLYYLRIYEVAACVKLSLLNSKGEKRCTFDINETFAIHNTFGSSYFVERSIVMNKANDLLHDDDTLVVLCEIYMHDGLANSVKLINGKEVKDYTMRLEEFDRFEELLESENYSDVTFLIENEELRAHKTILIARSAVFEAMLASGHDKKVEIEGIKYDVFRELLRFVYSGKVYDLEIHAKELLIAAERFSIGGLKAACEKWLSDNLTTENILEYLELADLHSLANLRYQAVELISLNLKEVVVTPQFSSFGQLNPEIINEVMRKLAKLQIEKML